MTSNETTSPQVASIAARVLPMGYLQFIAFIATPENFRAVKSALASTLTQAKSKGA